MKSTVLLGILGLIATLSLVLGLVWYSAETEDFRDYCRSQGGKIVQHGDGGSLVCYRDGIVFDVYE